MAIFSGSRDYCAQVNVFYFSPDISYVKEASEREIKMLINAQPTLTGKHKSLEEFQSLAESRMKCLDKREDEERAKSGLFS